MSTDKLQKLLADIKQEHMNTGDTRGLFEIKDAYLQEVPKLLAVIEKLRIQRNEWIDIACDECDNAELEATEDAELAAILENKGDT